MRMITRVAIGTVLLGTLLTVDAAAWGPRAQRALSGMALQLIKGEYASVFRPSGVTGSNYERDVLRGCQDGWAILKETNPLNSNRDTVQAIGIQIELLREARNYGPSSYFAYRMGVVAALTADVMVPYGFTWTDAETKLQKQINKDIDAHLDAFFFPVQDKQLQFIRGVQGYFAEERAFYADDKRIIADDYRRGNGFNGFLKKGAQAYFTRSVNAIADVWHTILRVEGDSTQVAPSHSVLTQYFVDEIAYLLEIKKNSKRAEKSYENLVSVNPGLASAYEKVGDLYYEFGGETGKARGVREWHIAFNLGGTERNRVAGKLSVHYLQEGKSFLAKATRPDAEDTDLPDALRAFEQALEVDRGSEEVADLIQKTNVAIVERNERFEMTVNIIAAGEKVCEEGDKAKTNGEYSRSIASYRQAISTFEGVSDEFKEQDKKAKENVRRLKKKITDVVHEVLDKASDAIDEGDKRKEENRFEDAIAAYNKVAMIVEVIPEDLDNTSLLNDKKEIVQTSLKKVDEAKTAKLRYEQAMQAQEAAGGK